MNRLHLLGDVSKSRLERIGALAMSGLQFFVLLYDNVNKHRKAWRQTIASHDQVKSGTAATGIVLEDVGPRAFDPGPYYANVQAGLRNQLTASVLLEDINHSHLLQVPPPILSSSSLSMYQRFPVTLHLFRADSARTIRSTHSPFVAHGASPSLLPTLMSQQHPATSRSSQTSQ